MSSVAAVAEDAVGAVSIRGNSSARNSGFRSALDQNCRIQAVEVAAVSAVGIPGLADRRIVQGDVGLGNQEGVFIRGIGGIGLADLRFYGCVAADLRCRNISNIRRLGSGRISAAETAATGRRVSGRGPTAKAVRRFRGIAAVEAFRRLSGRVTGRVAAVETGRRFSGGCIFSILCKRAEGGEQKGNCKDER